MIRPAQRHDMHLEQLRAESARLSCFRSCALGCALPGAYLLGACAVKWSAGVDDGADAVDRSWLKDATMRAAKTWYAFRQATALTGAEAALPVCQ